MAEEATAPTPEVGLSMSDAAARLADRWNDRGNEEETTSKVENTEDFEDESEDTLEEVDNDESDDAYLEDENTDDYVESDESDDDEESYSFSTIDEVAEAAGQTKGEFMENVSVRVRRADGSVENVNLHGLVQGYQKGAKHREEMKAVEEARSNLKQQEDHLQARYSKTITAAEEALAVAAGTLEAQEKAVNDYYDAQPWAQIRARDEAKYAAMMQDRDAAVKKIKEDRDSLRGKYQKLQEEHNREMQKKHQEYIQQEHQRLVERRPEWADDEARSDAGRQIAGYLKENYGASDQEIATMFDHRMLDITYKALLFDQALAAANSGQGEKVRKTGVLKPGKSRGVSTGPRAGRKKKASQARDRLRRTHKQADAAAALSARWESQGRNR